MKTALLIILFSVSSFSYNQTIKQSFILRVLPDNGWVLEFEKNGEYEYYHWNGWSSGTTIEKGNYKFNKGLISLNCKKCNETNEDKIPRQIHYTMMSEKEFENLDADFFASKEKRKLFGKKYIVLSEKEIKLD